MSRKQLDKFLQLLKPSPSGAVFNPWWHVDEKNDASPRCPAIRRKHLTAYFFERLGKARVAIIGEALGYRGGHFSGIPMTSERMLLGKHTAIEATLSEGSFDNSKMNAGRTQRRQILATVKPRRTSKPGVCPDGFSEPTATIVWGALLKIGMLPDEFVLWNAFPWHSFNPYRGLLSNRMPNKCEQFSGRPVLNAFFQLFPGDQIVALGKIAAAQLEQLGFDAQCVRHPASGGAKLFRHQIALVLRRLNL